MAVKSEPVQTAFYVTFLSDGLTRESREKPKKFPFSEIVLFHPIYFMFHIISTLCIGVTSDFKQSERPPVPVAFYTFSPFFRPLSWPFIPALTFDGPDVADKLAPERRVWNPVCRENALFGLIPTTPGLAASLTLSCDMFPSRGPGHILPRSKQENGLFGQFWRRKIHEQGFYFHFTMLVARADRKPTFF